MTALIFSTIHGSHLYGLAHEDSDLDVYEVTDGVGLSLNQRIRPDGIDVVSGSLEAFVRRALTGSHQSCEALFSTRKAYAPGMEAKYGAYLDGFRVTGGDVFAKYERTIRKFCYGDLKRRRHAVRLAANLRDLRATGRFDPTLATVDRHRAISYAGRFTDDALASILNVLN